MFTTKLFLIPLFSLSAHAATNDWSKPCFQGSCSYDFHPSSGSIGTLKVWGSEHAISDITTAAGWEILGCSPDALAQDIRLVCAAASGCDHLFNGPGAVGKLVRLPENCGKSAFARVAKATESEDQRIPSEVASKIPAKKGGAQPNVQALSLDTDFAAVSPTQGNVSFALQGSTNPNAKGNLVIDKLTGSPQRRSRIFGRAAESDFIQDAFANFGDFDKNITKTLPPIDIEKDIVLIDTSISCPAFSASVKADIDGKIHAAIDVGVAVAGSLVPPKIKSFGLYAGLNANIDGALNVAARASGSIDSGLLAMYEAPLEKLDIPGILTIGPSFKIKAEASVNLDAEADLKVDINYQVVNAKLYFPESANQHSGAAANPGNTPLKISVSPSVKASGNIGAHIIPTVDFVLDAFSGLAKATVTLTADASTALDLDFKAQGAPKTRSIEPNADAASSSALIENRADEQAKVASTTNGCVDLRGGLHVNAGVEGSFLGLFDPSKTIPIFNKDYEIFKACLAGVKEKRESTTRTQSDLIAASSLAKPGGIVCPGVGVTAPVMIVNKVIAGTSITPL